MTADAACFVIAGGPSLAGFDFARLPAGYRIGANKSAWIAKCDALVTVDHNFHREYRDRILSFPGAVYVASDGPRQECPNATYWKHTREGFSWGEGRLAGSNSGFAAFNLAVLLGFTEIALLGFDFKWHEDRSHFHGGYKKQSRHADRQLGVWVKAFDEIAPQVKARVTHYIGPEGTRLNVFPQRPLASLLQ